MASCDGEALAGSAALLAHSAASRASLLHASSLCPAQGPVGRACNPLVGRAEVSGSRPDAEASTRAGGLFTGTGTGVCRRSLGPFAVRYLASLSPLQRSGGRRVRPLSRQADIVRQVAHSPRARGCEGCEPRTHTSSPRHSERTRVRRVLVRLSGVGRPDQADLAYLAPAGSGTSSAAHPLCL